MIENNDDKELRNAMDINKDDQNLKQLKDQMQDLQNQCNAAQLTIAGKGTEALKIYDELVRGMDDSFLGVLSNGDVDDDFHLLEAITSYDHKYASELRRLSRYWSSWYETLE